MIHVKADAGRNRIYIKMMGRIAKEDVVNGTRRLVEAIAVLKDGFDIINDISGFSTVNQDGEAAFREVTSFLKRNRVGQVVRIVGSSKENLLRFATFDKAHGAYGVEYTTTLKEAEDLLFRKRFADNVSPVADATVAEQTADDLSAA